MLIDELEKEIIGYRPRIFRIIKISVLHRGRASEPGSQAWAGVGWSRHSSGSGAGLFVEHTGVSKQEVRRRLTETLDDMAIGRGGQFSYDGEVLSNISCTDRPSCAVVVASYRTMGWDQL